MRVIAAPSLGMPSSPIVAKGADPLPLPDADPRPPDTSSPHPLLIVSDSEHAYLTQFLADFRHYFFKNHVNSTRYHMYINKNLINYKCVGIKRLLFCQQDNGLPPLPQSFNRHI